MLHVLRFGALPAPDLVLRSMFAARKKVFVDLLKWNVPVIGDEYEIDQFDDEHAYYLVLADLDGRHLGSARLLPTTRPHILAGLYPELCDGAPPSGDDIFEITRFCLDRSLRARERRSVRNTLIVALTDHALVTGISAYSAIAEEAWLDQILDFGWHCRRLGPARLIGGQTLGALRIEIEPDTLERLARAGIRAGGGLLDDDVLAAA